MLRSSRNSHFAVGIFAGGALALSVIIPVPAAAQAPSDFTGIVRQKAPAVVAITTRRMLEEQPLTLPDGMPFGELFRHNQADTAVPRDSRVRQALGSGFIINADGYIVTNNHVVENASEIHVLFLDKTNVEAKLVGRDPATDIAVLKIEPRPNMTIASWGNSDAIESGAWTIAIGSPFDLGGTVTVGVLSARSRDIHSGPYDDFLQTDASINQGNSGGPLFNARGEVVGVNTAIFSPFGGNVGIGFAVPSNSAQVVASQLIGTGRMERGWLGVQLQELTSSLARALGLRDEKGAVVASVEPGSPAEKSGLWAGDVITELNRQPVENPREMSRAVAGLKPGQQAMIVVYRDGRQQQVTSTIGERQEERMGQTGSVPRRDQGPRFGLNLAPIPDAVRQRFGLDPNTKGVVVQQVDPDSPAARSGIQQGDVILSANNREVDQPSDVSEEWMKSRSQNRPILLRLSRDGQYLYVAAEG